MDGAFDAFASTPADNDLHRYLLSTITSSVPLDIRTSTIRGAGSGVVALRPVAAGVEVFRVNEPFVSAAHDVSSVCDNCYISSAPSAGGAAQYSEEKLNLLDCKRCRSVRYCSKVRSCLTLSPVYYTYANNLSRHVRFQLGDDTTKQNAKTCK